MHVSLWVVLLVCVGFLSDLFLVLSEHIVCEWLPVISSLELCLLPHHTTTVAFAGSLTLSFFLTPGSHPSPFIFFPVCFLLLLTEPMHPSRHVKSGSWSWWILSYFILFFFKFPFIYIQPPKTKTKEKKRVEERRKKCLHEMLPLENLPGAVHNFASLLFELFNLFSIYLIPLDLLSVPVFFKSAHRVMM